MPTLSRFLFVALLLCIGLPAFATCTRGAPVSVVVDNVSLSGAQLICDGRASGVILDAVAPDARSRGVPVPINSTVSPTPTQLYYGSPPPPVVYYTPQPPLIVPAPIVCIRERPCVFLDRYDYGYGRRHH